MSIDDDDQAMTSGQGYLDLTGFSRSGLIQQLMMGDEYTEPQAEHAADVRLALASTRPADLW